MGAKRLILRADDAGGCASANDAILEAVEAGTIKNISLMACGSHLEEAAQLFAGRDDVCLGIHVCLNAEWDTIKWGPVLPPEQVSSLLDPGTSYFTPTPKLLNDQGFSIEEAVSEAEAQLACARAAGLTISYLDEHMFVGWIRSGEQKLRDAMAALCEREGLIDAMALSSPGLPGVSHLPPVLPGTLRDDTDDLIDRWLLSLEAAPPGTYLLVTHPGKIAPDMEAFYHHPMKPGIVARERERERRALIHPRFREQCAALGIQLVRYDEV